MSDQKPLVGELERASNGQFLKGNAGGPGRPKGSKNRITVLKQQMEEGFRDASKAKVAAILDKILDEALEGNVQAMKMVWDAHVSKAAHAEDKTAGTKQAITVHRMTVNQEKSEESSNEQKVEPVQDGSVPSGNGSDAPGSESAEG